MTNWFALHSNKISSSIPTQLGQLPNMIKLNIIYIFYI
jgi:hypothetical protein